MGPNSDEAALHRAIQDRPHDATPRLVLADFYDDHDMPEHALAHRWLSGEHAPPTTSKEWGHATGGMNGRLVAQVLGEEANKITQSAVRTSGPLIRTRDGVSDDGRRLSIVMINSQQAVDRAPRPEGDPDRMSHVTARNWHHNAASNHEMIASNHGTQSYIGVQDSDRVAARKKKHQVADHIHRLAQRSHYLAGQAHQWAEDDDWLRSREGS